MSRQFMSKEDALKKADWLRKLNTSGYAGCNSMGNLVDRREEPLSVPIQENLLLGVVEPKPLPDEKYPGEIYDKHLKIKRR